MVIGTSFLFSKKIFPNPENSVELVKEHFNIVKVEDMVPYVNKQGTNEVEHNSLEIDRIEEYG
jgi:L-cysteine desulfidase